LQKFLKPLGYYAVEVQWSDAHPFVQDMPNGVHCVVSGDSVDFHGCEHSVVGVKQKNGIKLIHDPGPNNNFISGDPKDILFICKLL